MSRSRKLSGCLAVAAGVVVLSTSVPIQASPASAGTLSSSTDQPWLGFVQGSTAGIAWDIGHAVSQVGPDSANSVRYVAFGRAGTVTAGGVVGGDQISGVDFSLIGSALYIDSSGGLATGRDIVTGTALPQARGCARTAAGCIRVPGDESGQYTYTPDGSGAASSFEPPPIEGSVVPGDRYFLKAADDTGAVIEAVGARDDIRPGSTTGTLDYLDFATGAYTVLDGTNYSEGDQVVMAAAHIVWTHDRHALYVDRDDVAAAPAAATPTPGVVELAVNGDSLVYTALVDTQYDGDYATPSVTYSGTLGSASFTQLNATPTGPLIAINNGDFGVSAGSTAADYGPYRLTPGSSTLGPRLALYGVAPKLLPTLPPDDFGAVGHSAQTVVDSSHRWTVAGMSTPVQFGRAGDVVAPTTGAGRAAQLTVFRPSNGTWYQRTLSGSVLTTQWGQRGDVPVAAHYAGLDEVSVLAVYRPANHRWYLRGRTSVQWGLAHDIPVPGHYDGTAADGYADEIAMYRPSNGTWYVHGHATVQWGRPGDIPAPGDYNGDGRTDYAVYRPSTQTWWIRGQKSPVRWGLRGDVPVTGDFNGDGRTDLAIYRPSTHTWWVRGVGTLKLGAIGDTVVGKAPLTN